MATKQPPLIDRKTGAINVTPERVEEALKSGYACSAHSLVHHNISKLPEVSIENTAVTGNPRCPHSDQIYYYNREDLQAVARSRLEDIETDEDFKWRNADEEDKLARTIARSSRPSTMKLYEYADLQEVSFLEPIVWERVEAALGWIKTCLEGTVEDFGSKIDPEDPNSVLTAHARWLILTADIFRRMHNVEERFNHVVKVVKKDGLYIEDENALRKDSLTFLANDLARALDIFCSTSEGEETNWQHFIGELNGSIVYNGHASSYQEFMLKHGYMAHDIEIDENNDEKEYKLKLYSPNAVKEQYGDEFENFPVDWSLSVIEPEVIEL